MKEISLLDKLKTNDKFHWMMFIVLYSLDNGVVYMSLFLMLIGIPLSSYINSELFTTDSVVSSVLSVILTLLLMLGSKLDLNKYFSAYKDNKEDSNE